jgi:co-chaperonin GroES (HSP10)
MLPVFNDCECVLFPSKKCRDWSKFQRSFKDGDIISNGKCICVYNGNENGKYYGLYVGVGHALNPDYFIEAPRDDYFKKEKAHIATEEEKQKLLSAINKNGYQWNFHAKRLEKLVQPKFKVGDKITNNKYSITISNIDDTYYYEVVKKLTQRVPIENQDDWKLVPNKFDITTLKPFESMVLVRNIGAWEPAFWGYYSREYAYPFVVAGLNIY